MIKVRPHALHRIMGEPRSIDPRLITDGVAAILRRTKRTDGEKALIQSLKNRTLSEGAKTAVEEWVVERAYGFKDFAGNKYTEKGLTLEDHAIKTVQMNSLFTMGQYVHMNKNEQTFENQWLRGTPDIINPTHGRDTKCSWSGVQHPWGNRKSNQKVKDAGYDVQCQAYMDLTDKPDWCVDFVLLPTPAELVWGEDQREQQVVLVEAIPLHKRIKTVHIPRDQAFIDLMHIKCELVQEYAAIYADEIGVLDVIQDRAKEYKVPFTKGVKAA